MFVPSLAGHVLAPPTAGLVLAEWTAEGSTSGEPLYQAPLHRHVDEDEAWYVLRGMLRVRLDDDEVEVPAGGVAMAPRGTAHTFWNPDPEPARYLLVMGARSYGLIEAIHARADRDEPGVMCQLFEEHGAQLL